MDQTEHAEVGGKYEPQGIPDAATHGAWTTVPQTLENEQSTRFPLCGHDYPRRGCPFCGGV